MKLIDILKEINLKKASTMAGMVAGSVLPFDINQEPDKPQTTISFDKEENTNISLNQFLKALHQVESGGREGVIIGDNGKALGPLQIHRVYWNDVASKVGGRYEDVTNYNYSTKVVLAYFLKYAKDALKNKDWETLAKIHNGGPKGHKKKSTEKYWQKVKSHL